MVSTFNPFLRRSLFLLFFVATFSAAWSQSPQKLNYQAIVRDAAGNPIVGGTNVTVRFNIHDGSMTGPVVFTETNTAVTNQFGLITQIIGGTSQLAAVNWGNGQKWLQVEIDPNGGNNFSDMGTTQLLSVPYALYSGNSVAGSTGPTGPQGLPGNNGATGPQGPQGPAGVAGPQGTAGFPGAAGATGPTGADGAAGTPGAVGPTGIQGIPGATGPQGDPGVAGAPGAPGSTGPQGDPGVAGLPGDPGVTGPQGDPGTTGPAGDAGPTGPQGDPGVPGAPGAPGVTGPQGDPGAVGPAGPQGDPGVPGAVGAQGPAGPTGPQGDQGNQGNQGIQGIQGPIGPQGLAGTPGTPGAVGPTGPAGSANVTVANVATTAITDVSTVNATNYVAIAGLTYTFTVPAGGAKVVAHAFGATANVGTISDMHIQFQFFLDGVATGVLQRVACLDGASSLSLTPVPYSLSNTWSLSAGSHTIDLRGVNAGPSGTARLGDDANTSYLAGRMTIQIFQ